MKEFLLYAISQWWGVTVLVLISLAILVLLSALFYRVFFKRFYDIFFSGLGLLLFSPILLVLTVLGAIKMKGNPFFTQRRPGKNEKIFKLIKFRTMTCEKDEKGELLPDEKRLTKYGKFLRASSLDELPELINIFLGHMSIIGPRPLLVKYLPLYSNEQRLRHKVRPGLTGYAQAHGRNALSWEERFEMDVHYVQNVSLWKDLAIVWKTVAVLFKREGIHSQTSVTMEEFKGTTI